MEPQESKRQPTFVADYRNTLGDLCSLAVLRFLRSPYMWVFGGCVMIGLPALLLVLAGVTGANMASVQPLLAENAIMQLVLLLCGTAALLATSILAVGGISTDHRISIDSRGLNDETELHAVSRHWTGVQHTWRTRHRVWVLFRSGEACFIPRRAVATAEQWAQLNVLVNEPDPVAGLNSVTGLEPDAEAVAYEDTPRDVRAELAQHFMHSQVIAAALLVFVAAMLLADSMDASSGVVRVSANNVNLTNDVAWLLAFLLAYGLYVTLVAPLLLASRGLLGRHVVGVDQQGVIEQTPLGTTTWKWAGVRRIVRARHYLYIWIGPETVVAVPRRAAASAEHWETLCSRTFNMYRSAP